MGLAPIDLSIDVMLWLFLRAGVLSEGMSHSDVEEIRDHPLVGQYK